MRKILHYDKNTGIFTWIAKTSKGPVNIGDIAGCIQGDGARIIWCYNRPLWAHRLAWLYVYGSEPKGRIDHINGDPADNRICNLREATARQNSWNKKKMKTNTSGFVGVHLSKPSGRWYAQCGIGGKNKHLGYFDTPEAASDAYQKFAKAQRGEFFRETVTGKKL